MPLKRSEVSAWVMDMQTAMATVVDQCSTLRTQLPSSYAAHPEVKLAAPVVSPIAAHNAKPPAKPPAKAPAHKLVIAKPKPKVEAPAPSVAGEQDAPAYTRGESTASNAPPPPNAEVRIHAQEVYSHSTRSCYS